MIIIKEYESDGLDGLEHIRYIKSDGHGSLNLSIEELQEDYYATRRILDEKRMI